MNFSCHSESVLKKNKMNPVFMEVDLFCFPCFYKLIRDYPPLFKVKLQISSGSKYISFKLIVLEFNYKSTLVGHFVSSPRKKKQRDRRDSRGDEIDRREMNMNDNEETEEIKTFSLYSYLLQGKQALPKCKPI